MMDTWLVICLLNHLLIEFPTVIHIHLYMFVLHVVLHTSTRIDLDQLVINQSINFQSIQLQLLQSIISSLSISKLSTCLKDCNISHLICHYVLCMHHVPILNRLWCIPFRRSTSQYYCVIWFAMLNKTI